MSGVNIRINASFYEDDVQEGTAVVGNIYSTDKRGAGRRNVMIPMGPYVAAKQIALDAGSYIVEALMPSGIILTNQVSVPEGPSVDVDFDVSDSPYESHAWQYLSGNLESSDVYHSATNIPTPRSYGSKVLTYEPAGVPEGPEAEPAEDTTPDWAEVWWIGGSRESLWGFEALNALAREWPAANIDALFGLVAETASPLLLDEPAVSDGRSHLFRFDQSGPVWPGAGGPQRDRQFAVIEVGADAFLATLPVPWMSTRQEDVQVELMVSTRQNPTGSAIAVAVRDTVLGPALSYLGNGALTMAGSVFKNVEGMLYDKMMNPFAAAAGAYVLVGTVLDRDTHEWHSWVQHLSDWFGWLPDGAILWGTLQLRTATRQGEVDLAREALKSAYARGVPVYTLGLRWLIDGLSEFPDDPDCVAMLQQARELSWRVDMRQPFVVLRTNGRRK